MEPKMSSRQRVQYLRRAKRTGTDLTTLQIENARLRREIARSHAERASLSRFIAEAGAPSDRESRYVAIVNAALQAARSDGAALYLYSADRHCTQEAFFAGYADATVARQQALHQAPQQLPPEQSLLDTGQPLTVTIKPDTLTRPYPDEAESAWHTLTLPLQSSGQIIGCLQLSRAEGAAEFTVIDEAFGRDLAASTTLIIERIEQETLIQQRAIRAEALREIGRQLSTELDFDRFLENAGNHLTTLLNVRDCVLTVWNEDTQELTAVLYINDGMRHEWRVTIRPGEQRGLTGVVVNERRTLHVPDYLAECQRRGIEPVVIEEGDWRNLAWVGVPLIARGQLVGVIVIERRGHVFSTEEIVILESLAGQLASAMENARLYAEVRQLATTDSLTGLANHRHLHERLEQELQRAIHYDRPLAIAMLDLDNFKRYNDTYGHQRGDELLRAIAANLRAEARNDDLLGRYGGDEFLLVLPETTAADAATVLARIGARLAALTRTLDQQESPIVTASVGIAAYPGEARSAHDLIALADSALYADKKAERVTT
jgi:diguanylate cyclase (GGDEF)-like protein